MHLTSFGAAETVTGSCHLLDVGGTRILIDCGLYQGEEDLEVLNREPFPFDVRDLDAVILTHAHLDHVGRLPVLTRLGYRGPIYCTPPTAALAGIVLLDSARLQVEDYRRDVRKARRVGEEDRVPQPLYDEDDVYTVQALLRPQLEFGETLRVGNVRVTPHRAGHILGSAYLLLDTPDGRLIMSGDLGNRESGLQQDFTPPPTADVLVTETTYADRTHRPLEQTLAEFTDALQRSVARGGKILIPTFAIERAQTILYYLKHLMHERKVPYVPVFLDSPMGARATHEYFEYGDELISAVRDELQAGEDPFRPSTLHVITTSAESQRLNRLEGSAIILAGNGMMSGGRIQHHLKHHLWKENTSLISVSYQSPHSLGGRIVLGEPTVRIMGEEIAVRAQVHTIGGFSAHADRDDLLDFIERAGNPKTWLVHGEVDVMTTFLGTLAERGVTGDIVPRAQQVDLRGTHFAGGRPPGLDVGGAQPARGDE